MLRLPALWRRHGFMFLTASFSVSASPAITILLLYPFHAWSCLLFFLKATIKLLRMCLLHKVSWKFWWRTYPCFWWSKWMFENTSMLVMLWQLQICFHITYIFVMSQIMSNDLTVVWYGVTNRDFWEYFFFIHLNYSSTNTCMCSRLNNH